MSLEESPKLSDYKDGIPDHPVDPKIRQKRFRIMLLLVLLLVLFLGGLNFMETSTADLLAGQGSVQGSVIDAERDPFSGYIFIVRTELETKTDENGNFFLENVPAGQQSLVVADEEFASEFPITVVAGSVTNVGQIQFIQTATP